MTKELSLFDIQDKLRFLLDSEQNFKLQLSGVVITKATTISTTLTIVTINSEYMTIISPDNQSKILDLEDMKSIPASELTLMVQTDVEDAIAAITVNAGPISSATDPRLTYTSSIDDAFKHGWYFMRDKMSHEPLIIGYIDGDLNLWYDNKGKMFVSSLSAFMKDNSAEVAGPIKWPDTEV